MNLVTLLAIILIIIIGILIILSIGIYRFIKKKNYSKGFRLITLIPTLIVGYFILDAIYPSEEFYKEDFTEVTGLTLPESADFIYKTATFPDQFGDYTSISIIKVDKKFYKLLIEHLSKNGFSLTSNQIYLSEDIPKKYYNGFVEKTYSRELTEKIFIVDFLSDKETIVIKRVSW